MLKPMRNLDRWFGAHQKIDRIARRYVASVAEPHGNGLFPEAQDILKFEGRDGPDGVKVKTPARDEPWHYYNPLDAEDTQLLAIIATHLSNLTRALKEHNQTRASFEAAWLSHAIVDGLTPAHHYPYEAELTRLRGGAGIESRTTAKEKLVMHGDTVSEKLRNNWSMWGEKGLISTHLAFEWGVALTIIPVRYQTVAQHMTIPDSSMTPAQFTAFFQRQAGRVMEMHLYEEFYRSGWTPRLAGQVRRALIPIIVESVATAWLSALHQAEMNQS